MLAATFSPRFPWTNPHVQTIGGRFLRAPAPDGTSESFTVPVTEVGAVRCDATWPGEPRAPRGTVLLVHGLAGCAESHYMRHSARAALARGHVAVRMNLRGCGGTFALSRALHNAGQSDDIRRVLTALDERGFPRPFIALGFSLGGNLVLRDAGLAGTEARADAVAAVNPPIDLALCCRSIDAPRNAIYRIYFVTLLCQLVGEARPYVALPHERATLWSIRTLWRFDDRFTAPHAGYPDAAAYYAAASAGPTLPDVRVPTLVLSAEDDPFVPPSMFEAAKRAKSAHVEIAQPRHGGHVGYVDRARTPFWAAEAVLDWAAARLG